MSFDTSVAYLSTPESTTALLILFMVLNIPLFLLWQINDRPDLHKIFHPGCPKTHLPQAVCRLEYNLLMHTTRRTTVARWRLLYTIFTSLFSCRDPDNFLADQAGLLMMAWRLNEFPQIDALWLLYAGSQMVIVSTAILGLWRRYPGIRTQGMEELVNCWFAFIGNSDYNGAKWDHAFLRLVLLVYATKYLIVLSFAAGGQGNAAGRHWTDCEVSYWLCGMSLAVGAMCASALMHGNPWLRGMVAGMLMMKYAAGPLREPL